MFAEADFSRETMTAAMTLVANTDALIVDLRNGLGGEPATVAYVCSYLFDQRTHLSDLEDRGKPAEEFWTSPSVPGPHFGGSKPVFVLTSSKTFSGAEEFAYDLKQLHRATIVGETTGGGANPGEDHRVAEHVTLFIPDSRSVNPYTGTNWDGVGVIPDVRVSAEKARLTAEKMILQQLIKEAPNSGFLEARRKRLRDIEASS
jgi:C-terminal processing protease CtpA/Prc